MYWIAFLALYYSLLYVIRLNIPNWCYSYGLGFIIWPLSIGLCYLLRGTVCGLMVFANKCKLVRCNISDASEVKVVFGHLFSAIGVALTIYTAYVYTYFHYPSTDSIPVQGRWVDILVSHAMLIVYVLANYDIEFPSLTDVFAIFLANHASPATYIFMFDPPTRKRTPIGATFTSMIYTILACFEFIYWLQLNRSWFATHCFLNSYIDIVSPKGLYSVAMIVFIYIMAVYRIQQNWFVQGLHLQIYGFVVMIVLFYNLAPGLAMFFIYEEGRRLVKTEE